MTAGIIDEIKQRVDIVEVISEQVPGLKKAGRNFKAPCPFHAEKVPSFYVFPDRQSWHCFGACATGGDVFSFIMKREGIDFGEALQLLARRTGLNLASTPESAQKQKEANELKDINDSAAQYYHRLLLKSGEGLAARRYLETRGVSESAIKDFQLGYSPDGWEILKSYLVQKGYAHSKIKASGLLIEKEQGRPFDRFRNRLMFPIRGTDGKVSGFGARALDDAMPKYLNSPQTSIFDKSGSLYGLDRARAAVRQEDLLVIVEGYMDVLVAHQYGFKNVVASLGTALTEKQVRLIKKLTKNLTLALDSDVAGQMATLRGIEVASGAFDKRVAALPGPQGMIRFVDMLDAGIKVMVMPEGMDPDDVIKADPEHWRRLLRDAVSVVDFTFNLVVGNLDLNKVEAKTTVKERLLPVIAEIKEHVSQAHYLQKLSRLVGVDERDLKSELRQLKSSSQHARAPVDKAPVKALRDPLAEYLIALLARYPALRSHVEKLSADVFPNSESRELYLAWCSSPASDLAQVELEPSLREYANSILQKEIPPMIGEEQEGALHECIRRLEKRWLQELKRKEMALFTDAQAEGKDNEYEQLQELGIERNSRLLQVFLDQRTRK